MTGGTPLFADSSITTIRGLIGALIILALAAMLIMATIGERRYGPTSSRATFDTGATIVTSEFARER